MSCEMRAGDALISKQRQLMPHGITLPIGTLAICIAVWCVDRPVIWLLADDKIHMIAVRSFNQFESYWERA